MAGDVTLLKKSISQVDRHSLRHTVLHHLRQAIITGELKGDQQLNEMDLAQRLGVSRGLIREVLREMEASGIVVSIPYRGSFVRNWTSQGVYEVFTLRCRLEQYAMELSLPRMTDKDIQAAADIVASIREAAVANDTMQLVELDVQLHHRLWSVSGHSLLLNTLEGLSGQTRMIIVATKAYDHDSVFSSFEEDQVISHEILLDAVRTRDVEIVRRALEEHISGVGNRVCDYLRQREESQIAQSI